MCDLPRGVTDQKVASPLTYPTRRHRERAHEHPGGARRGAPGSRFDALPDRVGRFAGVVARRTCSGQDAAGRIAVPGAESVGSYVNPSARLGLSCRGGRGGDYQGGPPHTLCHSFPTHLLGLAFFGEHAHQAAPGAFTARLAPLRRQEWVVYAKAPFAGPEAVLADLSRYTHRAAFANTRLIADDAKGITLTWKDYPASGRHRHKRMTLAPEKLMRPFLLNVPPARPASESTASARLGPRGSRPNAQWPWRRSSTIDLVVGADVEQDDLLLGHP